ncbi:MAG: DMT family transporter, partial [Firmicutes bacterium]|nr:DMT family transporter [Bacillota bacterium]
RLAKAIFFMVASAFCSAMMSTCTKLVPGVPAMEKTFFTAFVCMIAAWIIQIHRHHEPPHFLRKDIKDLTLRAVYGIISIYLTFWCASAMDIGDATALFNLSPTFTMIYAHFAMGERFDRRQGLLVVLAFIGGLFVVKPSFHNVNLVPALAAVLCGMIGGLAHAYVRKLNAYNKVEGNAVILYNYTFSAIVELLLCLKIFVFPDARQLFWMLAAGGFCFLTQVCMNVAFSLASASEVSVYKYTQIIISSIIGMAIFAEFPDALSVAGYVVIIGSAVIMWRYNASLEKAQ